MNPTPRIRPFAFADMEAVNTVYGRCHPEWPAKLPNWWWGHPTLVLDIDGKIVGATACSISLAPAPELARLLTHDRAEIGWGQGVYVDPQWRGHGWGWHLAEARHVTLRAMGIQFFLGMTQPDNAAMIAIFERQRLTRGQTVPQVYPDGQAGVVYSGGIR